MRLITLTLLICGLLTTSCTFSADSNKNVKTDSDSELLDNSAGQPAIEVDSSTVKADTITGNHPIVSDTLKAIKSTQIPQVLPDLDTIAVH